MKTGRSRIKIHAFVLAFVSIPALCLATELPWHSTTAEDMLTAACQTSIPSSKSEIQELLDSRGVDISLLLKRFTFEEIEDIAFAVLSFPQELMGELNQISFSFDGTQGEMGKLADARGVIFPAWRKLERFERRHTIAHELAHMFSYRAAKVQSSPLWSQIDGGWNIYYRNELAGLEYGTALRPGACVSKYAADSPASGPHEDWAESVASYRFAPAKLRDASPLKYEFIKNFLFGEVEYLPGMDCSKPPLWKFDPETESKIAEFFRANKNWLLREAKKYESRIRPPDSWSFTLAVASDSSDPRMEKLYRSVGSDKYLLKLWLSSRDREGKRDFINGI